MTCEAALLHIDAKQVNAALDWASLIAALRAAHRHAVRPHIADLLLAPAGRSLLVRAAIFDGVGIGLKAVTVFPQNPAREPPMPTVQGAFLLFDEADGRVLACIDGAAITPWKTAADSALGSSFLARRGAKVMTMIGAGVMARPLIEAHLSVCPAIEEIILWNRTKANAESLAVAIGHAGRQVRVTDDLRSAVSAADLISTATLATEPLIRGEWLKPGAHVDLVGAFRPDMREADDRALIRGRIFVDARETTLDHIGELRIPLQAGIIEPADIEGDFFDLCGGMSVDRDPGDITIFKNGGGAHLDLITARHIYSRIAPKA
jgi:ornithine cyclodeaminase